MVRYSYKKQVPNPYKSVFNFISYSFMTIGALFLFWSFYPIIASELYSRLFINNNVNSPVSITEAESVQMAEQVKGHSNKFTTNLVDYTKASSWFENPDAIGPEIETEVKEYTISIPKLDIENARVIVGGDDLLAGIIHYVPKTMPGKPGVVSLFGHSSLLSLYKPNDYKHIFSHVPFLENGDVIYITVNGVTYTYEVYDKEVVKPTDVDVLNQQFDNSYVNLITCVPQGTYLNRAVVKARLKDLSQTSL